MSHSNQSFTVPHFTVFNTASSANENHSSSDEQNLFLSQGNPLSPSVDISHQNANQSASRNPLSSINVNLTSSSSENQSIATADLKKGKLNSNTDSIQVIEPNFDANMIEKGRAEGELKQIFTPLTINGKESPNWNPYQYPPVEILQSLLPNTIRYQAVIKLTDEKIFQIENAFINYIRDKFSCFEVGKSIKKQSIFLQTKQYQIEGINLIELTFLSNFYALVFMNFRTKIKIIPTSKDYEPFYLFKCGSSLCHSKNYLTIRFSEISSTNCSNDPSSIIEKFSQIYLSEFEIIGVWSVDKKVEKEIWITIKHQDEEIDFIKLPFFLIINKDSEKKEDSLKERSFWLTYRNQQPSFEKVSLPCD